MLVRSWKARRNDLSWHENARTEQILRHANCRDKSFQKCTNCKIIFKQSVRSQLSSRAIFTKCFAIFGANFLDGDKVNVTGFFRLFMFTMLVPVHFIPFTPILTTSKCDWIKMLDGENVIILLNWRSCWKWEEGKRLVGWCPGDIVIKWGRWGMVKDSEGWRQHRMTRNK